MISTVIEAAIGGLFYKLHKICVFFVSGVLFVLAGVAIWIFFIQTLVHNVPRYIVYLVLAVIGVVGGAVSFFITQPSLIASTSLGGSFLVVCAALIIIDLPTFDPERKGTVPWEYYTLGGAWIGLSLFSIGF